MGEVLRSGVDVIHSDADALWLNDPSPLLASAPASIIAGRGANKEDWLVCMGWVFFRATPQAKLRASLGPQNTPLLIGEGKRRIDGAFPRSENIVKTCAACARSPNLFLVPPLRRK